MQREARKLYKSSEFIQEAIYRYYNKSKMEIKFGEGKDESDYKRVFGFCKIKPTKLEDEESEDEVPSSTDDESEYDEY